MSQTFENFKYMIWEDTIYYPKENLEKINIINIFIKKGKLDGIVCQETQERSETTYKFLISYLFHILKRK